MNDFFHSMVRRFVVFAECNNLHYNRKCITIYGVKLLQPENIEFDDFFIRKI
jgi:hypothetical protein